MPAFIDLTGHKYGRWTVLSRAENNRHNQPRWLCRCECGNEKIVTAGILRAGGSKSCGCLNLEIRSRICIERNTTHGHSTRNYRSRTYRIWVNLSARHLHKTYRNVKVCKRWRKFSNFLADMGECPSPEHTLDRYPNNKGHYEPGNCRWATQKQQQNNRTNNRHITLNGVTRTLMQWSDRTGIHHKTISTRLKRGWSLKDALTIKPVIGANNTFNKKIPRRNSRLLTFRGKTMTLADWSRETGIHYRTINTRLDKQGWSVERALTVPPSSSNR